MAHISIRDNKATLPGLRLCQPPESSIVCKIEERLAQMVAKARLKKGFENSGLSNDQ